MNEKCKTFQKPIDNRTASKTSPTYEITEERLQELLADATKKGIQLGKDLVLSDKKIPIDSPAFNPNGLFQRGRFPSLNKVVREVVDDKHNIDGQILSWNSSEDHRNFYASDVSDAIRKLTTMAFNAKNNKGIPLGGRQDAVDFYDLIAEEWLEFADDHLPYFPKKGGDENAGND